MNETPQQEHVPQDPPLDPPLDPATGQGVRTENLRSYRALRRSVTDRKIAGVAGGLGRHLGIDPVIFRVLFVVLVFFGGSGLLLYGAAWLLVPEEGSEDSVLSASDGTRNALLIGAAVLAGLLLLGDAWGPWYFPWWLVPLALVGGAVLLFRDNGPQRDERPERGAPAPPPYPAPPAAGWDPAWQSAAPGWQPPVPPVAPAPPAERPSRKRGPLLFGFTLALVAVGLGTLGLVEALGTEVPDPAYPALALAITGAMLVVGSFFGRAGGLILLGVVSAVALAGASVADPGFDGDRVTEVTPPSAAAVKDRYHVPAGQVVLDLTEVRDPESLDGRTIELEANAGELVVVLPEDVRATVDAAVDFGGAVDLPDRSEGGFGVQVDDVVGRSDAAATVELNLDLRFGHIEVRTS